MYGIVEFNHQDTLTFFFVTINLSENILYLEDRAGGKKPFNKVIPVVDIKEVTQLNDKSIQGIYFNYQGDGYRFVEYGNHTISIFSRLLAQQYFLVA
ncbi:hypothetical protein [Vagococcus jeotgali]|uniref:hypothetical protein n=1 Tax=Vagococcus jeotgali TaxID=3109030 RepID=UPI002DDACCD4|nr:hypothetical protein [Vagococcus sp. B2T-5]